MTTALIILAVWLVAAVPAAIIFGKACKRNNETHDDPYTPERRREEAFWEKNDSLYQERS